MPDIAGLLQPLIDTFGGILGWIATNQWLYDIILIIGLLGAFITGIMRGLVKTIVHVVFVGIAFTLSYFIFAPMIANFLLDDMFNLFGYTSSFDLNGVPTTISSLREMFVVMGTHASLSQPMTAEFSSAVATTLFTAISMLMLSAFIYFFGWIISFILYLPFMGITISGKKKARAAGKKYKKHRLLAGLVSLVGFFIMIFFALNAGFAVSAFLVPLANNVPFITYLAGLIPLPGGDVSAVIQGFILGLPRIGDGGMFASALAFNGAMYSVPVPATSGTDPLTLTEAFEQFVTNGVGQSIEVFEGMQGSGGGGGSPAIQL